ncbi:MAG: TetR/AcrR family transcriptional regulator [Ilumatobacteraceae bacterium]
MSRAGGLARESILDSAERHFALHGVENASLRDIAVDAGQRNNSAVAYHFGDRAGLAAAVFSRSMSVINDARKDQLAVLESDGADSVEALVDILVSPLARHVASSEGWYGRFLARNRADRIAREVRGGLPESDIVREVLVRLSRQMEVPSRVSTSRLDHVMNHYTAALAGWEWARDRGEPRMSADELRTDLVATSSGLLTAPVVASTNRKLMRQGST